MPDRLREQMRSREVVRTFGQVSYADACRLARIERVAIDRRFAEADAERRRTPALALSDDELLSLARSFLHKLEVDARPIPLMPADREAELLATDELVFLVGQTVEDATVQRVAKSPLRWAGRKVDEKSAEFLRVCEATQQA